MGARTDAMCLEICGTKKDFHLKKILNSAKILDGYVPSDTKYALSNSPKKRIGNLHAESPCFHPSTFSTSQVGFLLLFLSKTGMTPV